MGPAQVARSVKEKKTNVFYFVNLCHRFALPSRPLSWASENIAVTITANRRTEVESDWWTVMPDLSIRKTQELSPVAKQVVEALLGRSLRDDEEVAIWASSPHDALLGQPRKEAWDKLNRHLDLMASKADGPAEDIRHFAEDIRGNYQDVLVALFDTAQ